HLPGGVAEYLRRSQGIAGAADDGAASSSHGPPRAGAGSGGRAGSGDRAGSDAGSGRSSRSGAAGRTGGSRATTDPAGAGSASSAAEQRAARKEMAATERRMNRVAEQIAAVTERMADHDPADYTGLAELTTQM